MKKISAICLIVLCLIYAWPVSAVSIYFFPEKLEAKDGVKFSVDLMIDAADLDINTLAGQIVLPENLRLVDVYQGDSIVNFWLESPELISDNRLGFSGIVPGGFSGVLSPSGMLPGKVLTLVLQSTEQSSQELSLDEVEVYLNDGHGTEVENVNFGKFIYQFNSEIERDFDFVDQDPPEPFEIEIVKDQNRTFIVFDAQDQETGVKYYEIKVNGDAWQLAKSPFEIDSEIQIKNLEVKAVDHFGNIQVSTLATSSSIDEKEEKDNKNYIFIILLILAMVSLLGFIKRKK